MSALPGRTEADVQSALAAVMDPELPFLSIVDLGIVGTVEVGPGRVRVELLPTFVGCPALDLIRDTVVERLTELAPDAEIGVEVSFAPPWTSDRISEEGRRQLRLHGFAPPERLHDGGTTAASPWLGSATASATTAILLLRRVPLPALRIASDRAGERLRFDAVPSHPSLLGLPPAVRAVQARLTWCGRPTRPSPRARPQPTTRPQPPMG